jgi:DNA polymerase III subunit delta'
MPGNAMPQWTPLPWQQQVWLEVTSLVLQQRLPHALLISGPAGIGKRRFARALIAFALCGERSGYACGQCRSCQQLAVGAHPDALLLGTDGLLGLAPTPSGHHEQGLVHWQPEEDRKRRDIAINAARKLTERLSLSSHYDGTRAALIDPADALNVSSVNALLKTIEEPPPATHLLLVCERPQALPATLRSRCQRVRLHAPDTVTAGAWLHDQTGRDESAALAAAHGAPLLALDLALGDALAEQRNWGELWMAVGRRRKDPVSAAASVERDDIAAHLRWALGWLHTQFRQRVLAGASAPMVAAWTQVLDETVEANRLASGNAQPQLLLESLFVQWLRLGPQALGSD